MDQSIHDVRRSNWLNIVNECQQMPANMTMVSKKNLIITGSKSPAKKRMGKCGCRQPPHLQKSRLLRSLFR